LPIITILLLERAKEEYAKNKRFGINIREFNKTIKRIISGNNGLIR
jgi:hypothetical protein